MDKATQIQCKYNQCESILCNDTSIIHYSEWWYVIVQQYKKWSQRNEEATAKKDWTRVQQFFRQTENIRIIKQWHRRVQLEREPLFIISFSFTSIQFNFIQPDGEIKRCEEKKEKMWWHM